MFGEKKGFELIKDNGYLIFSSKTFFVLRFGFRVWTFKHSLFLALDDVHQELLQAYQKLQNHPLRVRSPPLPRNRSALLSCAVVATMAANGFYASVGALQRATERCLHRQSSQGVPGPPLRKSKGRMSYARPRCQQGEARLHT